MSIHNVERRLAKALDRLENLDISQQNKQDIKDFLNYIAAHGCSIARQCKYIYPLENIARWMDKDYLAATKTDIEALVTRIIQNEDYTAWTKQDYMVVIKKFYKWLYNRDEDDEDEWVVPKLVKFIKIKKPKGAKTVPSDLLTPKEVRVLADHAKDLREKALVLTLYETGARIGELLNLKIKDVAFDDYGAKIRLPDNGKTGPRWIRVVGSAPVLSEWLVHEHPKKTKKNAFLFCKIRPDDEAGNALTYAAVRKILSQIQKRSGIDKNIRPHLWRHARATELAEHLTDAQRCKYFGWVDGSEMARIYTHLVDTDHTILELNGLIKKEKDKSGKFSQIVCPRCETKNAYGAKICCKCFLGLDSQSIEDFEKVRKSATELGFSIESMLNDPEFRIKMMNMMAEEWDKLQKSDSKNSS
jgi:integrase/recombinase XerD